MQKKNFDIIIVGAGSAGCTLANRLSSNPKLNIGLIEAGKNDNTPFIQVPILLAGLLGQYPIAKNYTWTNLYSQDEKYIGKTSTYQPRGKSLGGSSSMNAMIYIRGHKWDYDNWAAKGCKGWDYESCLPYFIKSEKNDQFNNEYHGTKGELSVSGKHFYHQICDDFINSGTQLGYNILQDFNSNDMYGLGRYQRTQVNGQRCSTSKAFLQDSIKQRPNLTILTGLHTKKIVMDGKRATGIEVIDKSGQVIQLDAKEEVILSAGALQSPVILQLSGIGDKKDLDKLGINTLINIQGVGKNLHDHPDVVIQGTTTKGTPLNYHPKYLLKQIQFGAEYLLKGTGELSSNAAEVGGFIKTDEKLELPDTQLHFVPALITDHGRQLNLLKQGCSLHSCILRPKSRGFIVPGSLNPLSDPYMCFNYLKEEQDREDLVKGTQKAIQLFKDTSFRQKYITDFPQFKNLADLDNIDKIREFVIQKADTIYHPVGSCKMGIDDMSVVDPEDLKVQGTENLRVIDASIMPEVVTGNTNAPTIMIAEKMSDRILKLY